MRCGSCGHDNRADSVYCGQCRAALTRPCPACGEPAPSGAAACLACGASLTATVPLPGAGWQGAPGESTAVYAPADLAGVGMADEWLGVDSGETRFTGVARDVQQRQDEHRLYVDFRIERHDPSGNRLAPVPVEMQGATHRFAGRVSNGDEIRVVDGTWRHGTLRVRELDNLTTGAKVRSGEHTEAEIRQAQIKSFAMLITIIGGFFLFSKIHVGWAIAPVIVIAFFYLFMSNSRRSRK